MKKFTRFNPNIILGIILLAAIAFSVIKIVQSAALNPGHAWNTLDDAPLPVANGGTGLATLTTGNVILGAGTSNVTFVAPGTSGYVLTSNGSTWTSAAAPAGGGFPTGTLASNVTETTGTAYTAIFTIAMTVSKMNIIHAILAQTTSGTAVGIQTRGRVTQAGHTGYCKFRRLSSAVLDANLDNIAVSTAPLDTAQTAELAALYASTEVICTVLADANAGNLVIEFQAEVAGTVTTAAGSYYTKVAP